MEQLQSAGVQAKRSQLRSAVKLIPQNGKTHPARMDAYLMGTAGGRVSLQERIATAPLHHFKLRLGQKRAFIPLQKSRSTPSKVTIPLPQDEAPHFLAFKRNLPVRQKQIGFLDLAFGKLLRE